MYFYSLHVFNRAGHFIIHESSGFKINSKQIPSSGIVHHTANLTSTVPIGFQNDLTYLCAHWYGFDHYNENLTFDIACGTKPYRGNIQNFTRATGQHNHCFEDLYLEPYQKYFITVRSYIEQDYSEMSSCGIFIGDETEILKNASILVGSTCTSKFRHIIYSQNTNITDDNIVDMHIVELPMTSSAERTLKITVNGCLSNFSDMVVEINNVAIPVTTWIFEYDYISLFYQFIQDDSNITLQLSNISNSSENILEIAVDECKAAVMSQIESSFISFQFSFNLLARSYFSHYELSYSSLDENDSSLEFISNGNLTEGYMQSSLIQGMIYRLHIKPCFAMTCLAYVNSYEFILEEVPPGFQSSEAYLYTNPFTDHLDTVEYVLVAKWRAFNVSNKNDFVKAYDYGVALEADGSSMVTKWMRITADRLDTTFEVRLLYLQNIYKMV